MLKNAGLTNSIGEFLLNSWTGFIGDGFINQVLAFLYFLKIRFCRFRPDFVYRCWPDGKIPEDAFNFDQLGNIIRLV